MVPFSSCPQSLPASGSFPMSHLFAWGGQSIGVSALASVPPMNTQDLSPSGQTMVEVLKIMATSFKRSHAHTATLSTPKPEIGHCWPTPLPRLLDTHSQVWVSLWWGHSSFLLGPGVHRVLHVPSRSLFPQSSVSSVGSMVGLMAASSKKAYAIPRSAAPKAPAPAAVHCWPVPPQETLKHSSISVSSITVSVGSLSPDAHKVCLSPLSVSFRLCSIIPNLHRL